MSGSEASTERNYLPAPELLRKLIHLGAGLPAFFLRDLGFAAGVAAAVFGLLVAGLFHLPSLRFLWRPPERSRLLLPALWLYPLGCLALVLVFRQRLELAAAGWALLAVGDGVSTLAGRAWGKRALPWNPSKTWVGSLSGWLAGAACASFLLGWTAPERYSPALAVAVGGLAALAAMLAESYPSGLDDNLSLPLAAGCALAGLAALASSPVPVPIFSLGQVALGAGVSLGFAGVGVAIKAMRPSGAAAGVLLATATFAGLGGRGFLLLATFVVTASVLTRLGYAEKAVRGLAEAREGRRGARNAIAKLTVPAFCALVAGLSRDPLFLAAFAGALAAALADTAGTEIGKLWGRRAFSPLSLRARPAGTPGAVSVPGLVATVAGAGLIAAGAAATGLVPLSSAGGIAAAGVTGALAESLLAAVAGEGLDHEASNLLNTLIGALAAAWF